MSNVSRLRKKVEQPPFDCDRVYEPVRVKQWEIVLLDHRKGFIGVTFSDEVWLPDVLSQIKRTGAELVDIRREWVPT